VGSFGSVQSVRIAVIQTSFHSPWENGVAERWVGGCRRELLDHIVALNEHHLRRLLSEFVSYYDCASYCPPSL